MLTAMTTPFQRGFTMIEALVAMAVLSIGLLGLAKLQVSSRQLEMESYQRAQAMLLLQDMVSRLTINSDSAICYAITSPANGAPYLGKGGGIPPACSTGFNSAQDSLAFSDLSDWNTALLGSSETNITSVGAMIDARGCIEPLGGNQYRVTVVWQGLIKTAAPQGLNCAQGLYGYETQRRAVSTVVTWMDPTIL